MTQSARVVLVAGGGTALRATWWDTPASSWASATTQNMPTFSGGASSSWIRVAYSPYLNMLAAITNGGSSNNNQIATSGDGGVTWVNRSAAGVTTFVFTDICWAPGLKLFVATANAGPTSSTRILTSPDGITWTARTLPSTGITLNGICCGTISGSDYLVAVGTLNAIFTSTDGITWTSQTGPTSQTWSSVCWNSGSSAFVACANSGSGTNNIMYSTNGTSWTSASTGGSGYGWTRIGYSSDLNQMIVVGGNTGVICYSTAGSLTAWTQFTTGLGGTAFSDVVWSHDYTTWVMVGNSIIYTCATCAGTWVSRTPPSTNNWLGAVAIPSASGSGNNLGIDGVFGGNLVGTMAGFNGTSSHTMTINTSQTDEIILLFIENECLSAAGAYATISSVTGGTGLTWARYGSPYQYRGGRNGTTPFNWNNMEVWWAHATAIQTTQTVTITATATVDNLSCCAVGVIGGYPTSPFDANGSLPAVANNGAGVTATTPSVSGVSTNSTAPLMFAFSGAPRAISVAAPPTGYASLYMGGDASGTDWGEQETAAGNVSGALSSATVAFGGTYTVLNWGMMVLAMVPPPVGETGTWSSTEATDTMSFLSNPGESGTWASTEAQDVFAGAVALPVTMTMTINEAVDVLYGFIYEPVYGPLAGTDWPDQFRALGGGGPTSTTRVFFVC